jgi:RecA/RadA recombinase
MPSLMENFKNKIKTVKEFGIDSTAEFDVMYSTGFQSVDFLNGTIIHVEDKKNKRNFSYNAVGLVDGSTNAIIGRSGSGKSTLTFQLAGNIVRPFINQGLDANIFIDDIEGSLPESRKFFLLGLTNEQFKEHVDIRNTNITAENVFKRIQTLHDAKIGDKKKYEYDTGLFDLEGNRIFKYIPSVYVIDSFAMLLPKDLAEAEDIGGSMSASSIAKVNTSLLKKINQLCKEANIILLNINHIMDDIQMGFIPKPAQISGLKQGERLPGGKTAIYLSNNMFRVDDSITLKKDKDYGIDGSVVTFGIVKSRTNISKRTVPLIFNKTEGCFDNELSLFQLLDSEGIIKGAGVSKFFEDLPDVKFSKKTFKKVLEETPELQEVFVKTAFEILHTYLSDTKIKESKLDNVKKNITSLFDKFSGVITEEENDE